MRTPKECVKFSFSDESNECTPHKIYTNKSPTCINGKHFEKSALILIFVKKYKP
jgi:hypothetical protein